MLDCCTTHKRGAGRCFSRFAKSYRKRFSKKGLEPSQKHLIEGITQQGISKSRLLEIGSGVGYLHMLLLEQGAASATGIDLSENMISEARDWAQRRGLQDKVEYRVGDFTDFRSEIDPADVTIMDKVICCYPDAPLLLDASLEKTQRVYAVTYPRDRLSTRIVWRLGSLFFKLIGSDFRPYLHSPQMIEGTIESHRFSKHYEEQTFIWLTQVYVKNQQ